LQDFATWLDRHIDQLREHSRDDLLSQLVAVRDEQGGLDDRELKATAGLILAAGFETTVNLLGNGARLLLAHPDQLAGLLATDAETATAAWTNAVNEILRFDPPVLLTGRTAVRDTEVAGRPVPAGDTVLTVLAGANRDPDVFENPAVFDVTRSNAADHLAFSNGRHYCLGAALARMEGEVGLSRLFRRFPEMRLLPGAERRDTRILRGYRALPVRLR
jgi:cytochrome P450